MRNANSSHALIFNLLWSVPFFEIRKARNLQIFGLNDHNSIVFPKLHEEISLEPMSRKSYILDVRVTRENAGNKRVSS